MSNDNIEDYGIEDAGKHVANNQYDADQQNNQLNNQQLNNNNANLGQQIPDPSNDSQGAVFGSEAFGTGSYGRQANAMRTGEYNDKYSETPVGSHVAQPANSQQVASDNQDGKKKKSTGWRVVFWLSIAVMIAALVALGVIVAGYVEGCNMYNEIEDEAFNCDDSLDLASMKVDWDKLLAINPETVAWVYMPGTQINYPVVHTSDNDKYLKTTFRGYKSNVSFGTIFMDCNNKHDLTDPNIVTYGHHMNDGSMYAQIAKLKNQEEFDNHRYIYFLTPQGNYKLRSFSVVKTNAEDKIIQTTFGNSEKMVEYINDKIRRSCVEAGTLPDVAAMSKIFTFSTCDYHTSDGRTLMFAYTEESTVPGVAGAAN